MNLRFRLLIVFCLVLIALTVGLYWLGGIWRVERISSGAAAAYPQVELAAAEQRAKETIASAPAKKDHPSLQSPVPVNRMSGAASARAAIGGGGAASGGAARRSLVERYYAGAERLRVTERALADGGWERVTVLRTNLKHPLLRVVDQLGPESSSGERPVQSSVAMAAAHWLVEPAESSEPELLDQLLKDGWQLQARLPQSGQLLVSRREGFAAVDGAEDFRSLQERLAEALSGLAVVEPDFLYYADGLADDPSFSDGSLWGLRNTGQSGGAAGADISAVEAWDIRNDASAVVVAVIDTGVRMTHEDLAANLWVNSGEIPGNGIDDDGNGVIDDLHGFDAIDGGGDPSDEDGHGTHVAGTIGAVGNNATGVTGVAWQVQLMPIRFLGAGGGFLSDAIESIAYAQKNGATILNNSWGGGGFSTSLRNAIANLATDDILFVAAAGNDGANSDVTPGYPAAYDLPHIVSVAASDRNDQLAGFSNFGPTSVDLAAPGVAIRSTFNGSDVSYATLNGTSMASPHVAGALAILRAEFPGEDAASLKARLLDTVDLVADFADTTVSGGRLNLEAALRNQAVPRPGVFRFSIDAVNAVESSGSVPVVVRRVGGSDGAVSVRYRTLAGSASPGEDFIAVNGAQLSWADGDAADRTILITLLDDAAVEGTETFALELFDPAGSANVGTPGRLNVNVLDDEAALLDGFDFTGASHALANFALAEPSPVLTSAPDGGYVWAEIEFTGTGVELLLRRHAANGALLWQRRHFAGGGVFQPQVTVAPDGGLFVGYSRITINEFGQITRADLAVLAYSPEGTLIWDVALPNSSAAIDLVSSVTVGTNGGVYVGGEYAVIGASDAFVARLDAASGTFSWIRIFKPNPNFDGDDAVSALAPAADGGVWAGGWTQGQSGFEGVLRRYRADGSLDWQQRYSTQGQQRVLDVAVNVFGEVYLSLRAFDNVTGVFSGKLFRVSSVDGTVIWERNQAVGSSAANFFIETSPNGLINYLQGPNALDVGSALYSVGRYDRSGEKRFENNLDAVVPLSVTGMVSGPDGGLVFTGAFDGLIDFGGNFIDSGGSATAYVARLLPQDPVRPGAPVFEADEFAVAEGLGELVVTVKREGGADGSLRIGLRSVEATATAGIDFIGLDTVLEFAPGQLSAAATLELLDDFMVEPDESLQLELYEVDPGFAPGTPASATVRLLNDDFAFEEWLGGFFDQNAPEAAAEADPDRDGQSNLLEYAFGGDPLQPDPAPVRNATPQPDGSIRFTYQRAASREALRYNPLISQDLVEWVAPTVIDASTAAQVDGMEAVTLDIDPPFDATEKAFFRIEVERSTQSLGP